MRDNTLSFKVKKAYILCFQLIAIFIQLASIIMRSWPNAGAMLSDMTLKTDNFPTASMPDMALSGDYCRVIIRELDVSVRVGLWEKEHEGPQKIRVNVEAWAPLTERFDEKSNKQLSRVIDYTPIYRLIQEDWPKRDHIPLLESLAEEALDQCFLDPRVQMARVSIEKIEIFPDAKGAGIEMTRRRPPANAF